MKKRLKSITEDDIHYLAHWTCPYCKKENQDYVEMLECLSFDSNIIECGYCKKEVKIKEPR